MRGLLGPGEPLTGCWLTSRDALLVHRHAGRMRCSAINRRACHKRVQHARAGLLDTHQGLQEGRRDGDAVR